MRIQRDDSEGVYAVVYVDLNVVIHSEVRSKAEEVTTVAAFVTNIKCE